MDEEELVRYLHRNFPYPGGKGIGDDASVRPYAHEPGGRRIVAKDIFIEGTHFSLKYFSLSQAAEKAVGANVSDMAAMGGIGEEIYLGLGFPRESNASQLREVFQGVRSACRRWKLRLGGGDISKAPCWMISVTICGHAVRPVYRDGARNGDRIGLIGRTGESALGLTLLERDRGNNPFSRRHLRIFPHLREARELARVASAMIDVSDGLIKDLGRILTASGVGAQIQLEKLPISRRMQACCRENGLDARLLALTGGEDYALLCCIPPQRLELLQGSAGYPKLIGHIRRTPRKLSLVSNGTPVSLPVGGYDHFAN